MKKFIVISLFCSSLICSFAQTIIPDSSFGQNGFARTDIGAPLQLFVNTGGTQVLPGPGNTFYLMVKTGNTIFVSRRLANGSIDPSYGSNGYSDTFSIYTGFATLQADGKIVIAGTYDANDGVIARLNTDGSPDLTWGEKGVRSAPFTLRSVAVQPDGKVVVVGGVAGFGFEVLRYNTDGSADPTFHATHAGSTANSVTVQPDGKILVGGQGNYSIPDAFYGFMLARYNPDGSFDASFDGDGLQDLFAPGIQVFTFDVKVQADKKIVIGGYSVLSGFSLGRYLPNGHPDSTFNGNGRQFISFPYSFEFDNPNSIAIQSDGKIVITGYNLAGEIVTARVTTAGLLDNSFDSDGISNIRISAQNNIGLSVLLQQGGKILLSGLSSPDDRTRLPALARLNSDGSLDNTFGTAGKILEGSPQYIGATSFNATAVQADGKIVAVGSAWTGTSYDIALARFNTNGNIDSTFGTNGKQLTNIGGADDATAVVIQPDGKIVIACERNSSNATFGIARYTTSGLLDVSFNGGVLILDPYYYIAATHSLALQNDGKIVVTGYTDPTDSSYIVIMRANSNGTLDNGFNGGGVVVTGFGDKYSSPGPTLIQPDGKIVVVGRTRVNGNNSFSLLRLNTNGSVDNSFSQDGREISNFGPGSFTPDAAAIQPNGKIIVAGYLNDLTQSAVVAHYNANGTPDNTFSDNGFNIFSPGGGASFAIGANGQIAAGGTNFAVTLYKSNGTPDSSFNGNGTFIPENKAGEIRGMVFQQNKLVVAGYGQAQGTFGVVGRYLINSVPPTGCTTPTLSAAITNVSCRGGSTGGIVVTTTGGSSPFTYAWTGPNSYTSITKNISGVKAGLYSVKVTGTGGCYVNASYRVNEPLAPLTVTLVQGVITCYGGTTPVGVYGSGGTTPYTGTGVFSNKPVGTYTYTITDGKGCSATGSITVVQPAEIVVAVALNPVSCKGGSTGGIDLSVSGGIGNFSYAWTGPDGFIATTQDITNVKGGLYSVRISSGQCYVNATYRVTEPLAPLGASISSGTIVCSGGTTNVYISPSGGTTPFTGSGTIANQAAGLHNYTVTDARGCSYVVSINIPAGASTKPATPGITGPSGVTANQADVQYSASTSGASGYEWVVPTGATITSGQNTNTIRVKFGTSGGKVQVIATNTCGSTPQVSKTVSVSSARMITKTMAALLTAEDYFTTSPNPAQGLVMVKFNALKSDRKFEIRISDVSGKTLFTRSGPTTAGENMLRLDMSRYGSSIYFITLISGNKMQTQKLIKTK